MLASLGGRIPLIIDGGADRSAASNRPSSRVDRRAGCACCGRGPIDLGARAEADAAAIEAPGQLASHYAPAKPLRLERDEAQRRTNG